MPKRRLSLLLLFVISVASSCSLWSSDDDKSVQASAITVPTAGAEEGFCVNAEFILDAMAIEGITFESMLLTSDPDSWDSAFAGVFILMQQGGPYGSLDEFSQPATGMAPFSAYVDFMVERTMTEEISRDKTILEPPKSVKDMAMQMDQFIADGGCE